MRAAALIGVLAAAAVGCGVGSGATAATPSADLRITVWPQGRGHGGATAWTLRCSPAGGTLPRRAAACTKLATMSSPFAPLPKGQVCTEQYGGPQQALVTGTFRGRRVWIQLGLRNGCEIARAKRLSFLLPGLGSAAA
jgi:hypothetical protein